MNVAIFYNLHFGGAKRVVFEHTKGLMNLGHTVDIYTLDKEVDMFSPGLAANKEYKYDYLPLNIDIPVLSRILLDMQVFYGLKNLHKKIARDIDSHKYDIVLVHTDTFTQAPFILRFLKTKNVYFCLEPLRMVYEYSLKISSELGLLNKIYESINRMVRKKIDRENARRADFTLAISLFGREYMINAFDLYPKISYLGVDKTIFKPLGLKKRNQVLFVAEKEYIYGYDLAKKAIELIPENIRPELKVLSISKNKRDRLTDTEIVKLYNESKVTLSLSNFDTFGLVVLESLACEVPVIAFNVAGYRETMIDGKTGFLVDFSPEEVAKKIIFLLNNPEKIEQIGKYGRNWVEERWTWEKQIKELDKLLAMYTNR